MYSQRLATPNDASAIAPLWMAFLEERSQYDLSMVLIPNFDYVSYVKEKLESRSIRTFVLEYSENGQIVGFLCVYFHDEMTDTPFQRRRIGGAIGMYVQPRHRKAEAITLLVESAIALSEEPNILLCVVG